ncbi:ATP-dependent helicase/nuclease subunit A [uncultured archaeon]|nr:ATP-dependent helicase/nuclease subunit A [uncultured archaeon]
MISWNDFEHAVINQLNPPRNINNQYNPEQNNAIHAPQNQSLFLAAGPGSGKTTVITLRILKLIFVDNVDTSSILVTTFTRKAAAELSSRILGWGDQLKRIFLSHPSYISIKNQLEIINFNNITIGTLDSIVEEKLGYYRPAGAPNPVVIEDFVSNALMIKFGLFLHNRHNNSNLKDYILNLKCSSLPPNPSEMSSTLREIKDRIYHDQININQYRSQSHHQGIPVACDAIDDYNQELQDRLLFDFTRLEHEFLFQLRAGTLKTFLEDINFILIDEYQDTNYLQEQIYFELSRAALQNMGSITVVGDDDQSLYRFRGATVDLFQEFLNRTNSQLNLVPRLIYLSQNYRSTPMIVSFCNRYISLDSQFQNARVLGKPPIIPARQMNPQSHNYPVLGMFRDDVDTLAHDLGLFIHRVIHGRGVQIQYQGNIFTIHTDQQNGSPADIALLFSSPKEFSSNGNSRLPLLLRNELRNLSPQIQIFNPRGQDLELIQDVQRLCGLILECIDPNSRIQNDIQRLPQDARDRLNEWRREAVNFINSNPLHQTPRNLGDFVDAWRNRRPLGRQVRSRKWEVPLLDLVYKLVTWIPNMQNDIEGLVYLEAISRTINQAGLFGNYESKIIIDTNNTNLEFDSVNEALWNIFIPIATGAIKINEDLLETLPNDRINVMSVHQAKGLEFPLVVVDVGSDFKTDHWKQRFRRFPQLNNNGNVEDGKSVNLENELRPHCIDPQLRQLQRTSLDRAFDDLTRQYFVSFSRAQDVLLLVGLNSVRNGYNSRSGRKEIPNIATGWNRNRNWDWGRGLPNLYHI